MPIHFLLRDTKSAITVASKNAEDVCPDGKLESTGFPIRYVRPSIALKNSIQLYQCFLFLVKETAVFYNSLRVLCEAQIFMKKY